MTVVIGKVVVVGTPREIVEALRARASGWKTETLAQYKRSVKRRAFNLYGKKIRTERNEYFVLDLAETGEIKILEKE